METRKKKLRREVNLKYHHDLLRKSNVGTNRKAWGLVIMKYQSNKIMYIIWSGESTASGMTQNLLSNEAKIYKFGRKVISKRPYHYQLYHQQRSRIYLHLES